MDAQICFPPARHPDSTVSIARRTSRAAIVTVALAGCGTGPSGGDPGDSLGASATDGSDDGDDTKEPSSDTRAVTTDDGDGNGSDTNGDGTTTGDDSDGQVSDSNTDGSDSVSTSTGGTSGANNTTDTSTTGQDTRGDGDSETEDGSTGDDDPAGTDSNGSAGEATSDGGQACVALDVPFMAGQNIEAGWVSVHFELSSIVVEVEIEPPWMLGLLHVYAGSALPGNEPGLFPFSESYEPHVTWASIEIPLHALDVACDDDLVIAVHGEVHKGSKEETAWAEGPLSLGGSWAMALPAKLCCP